nr:hypothetical protein [Tanacetum cinerariifolium]
CFFNYALILRQDYDVTSSLRRGALQSLLPIPLTTSSFPLPLLLLSTSCREGESSVAAASRQIRPTLTIDDNRRAEDRLIGRLSRERRYFLTLSTTYAQEVAHSCDYYTQIMDYCQSREVHTSTLVT